MDGERLYQNILNWTPNERRKRERPKSKWKEGVLRESCGRSGLRDETGRTDFDGDWVSKDVATRYKTTT
jgi:hypothetical protein